MFVKICGITRLTDALHAVEQGATAVGFVLWPASPRAVTVERAAEIIAELPSNVMTVGVFVNEPKAGVDTKLVNKNGEQLTVEFLAEDPSTERFVLFYKPSLERLGIGVSVRTVDSSQYENRLRQWDFDIVISSWGESLSPGNEQRGFWGSQAADQPGSRNVVGIKNPAVDALIDRVIFAKDRDELVAATRALDRVLLWNYYVVPQWTYGKVRTARWDRFGRPQTLPKYGNSAFPTVWWWDKDKAAKLPQRS